MSQSVNTVNPAAARPSLGLYSPTLPQVNAAHWRINGYRATILIWTEEEWAHLAERPSDAQYYPCGVWCALRLD